MEERRSTLRRHIERVTLHTDKIDILLKTDNGPELQSIPVQLQKIGDKKIILSPEGKDIVPGLTNKDPALIGALVRAHKWEKALATNQERSLGTISKTESLQIKYVTQIYRLNFLAPKLKEAILDGTQPRTLTLSRLMDGVPPSWREQQRLYGF